MNNLQKLRQLSFLLGALYLWQMFIIKPHGVNWDTLNVLALAKLPLAELFNVVMLRDFHPPGVHVMLHFWTLLFGDGDTSVIMFSALFALLGALGSGLVVRQLTKSADTGWLTGMVVLFSPFLYDPEAVMQYVVHLAATSFSWFFLLRMREIPSRQNWIGYALTTLLAVHSFVTAAMIVPFQLAYIFYIKEYQPVRIPMLGLCTALFLTLAPYVVAWLQPWHVAHNAEIAGNHPAASLYDLLLLPASLLFTRYDLIYFKPVLKPDGVLLLGLIGITLLGLGLRLLRAQKPDAFKTVLFIGILPPIALWIFGLLIQVPLFQNRTFLFCLPVVALAPVLLIHAAWEQGRKTAAIFLITGLVILMQVTRVPYQRPPFEHYTAAITAFYKPGDGLVLYPGMAHLGVLRYLKPDAFGLTERERYFNPTTENVYHMAQRIDKDFFFVTGEDVLSRPEIQARLKQFVSSHKRVLVVGFSPALVPAINCQSNVFILNKQGQFEAVPCIPL